MNINAQLEAEAQQRGPSTKTDGASTELRATRTGQLLTANWKMELVLAGHAYNVTIGTVGGEASITLITGGGAGTTIVNDLPEMAIGTPTGYFHIPLSFICAVQGDSAANANVANIVLSADVTQLIAVPIAASATVEVAQNLLDGGPDSVSRCASAHHTTQITNPVGSVILDFVTNYHAQVDATGTIIQTLKMNYAPSYPTLLKGPCSVFAHWGGTVAQAGMASYCWAEVPVAYFE